MDNPPINILSLFTGIGGLDLGVEAALEYLGLTPRVVCYCERQAYCQAVLLARMEEKALEPAPICSDLADIPGKAFRGVVDLIIGGPPCQPVSCAGKQKGVADERYLWGETLELVETIQPQVVFFENVLGLLSGRHAALIVSRLDTAGYVVAPPLRLRASDVGASHRRERIFIMAYRGSERSQGKLKARAACASTERGSRTNLADPDHHKPPSQPRERGPESAAPTGSGGVGDTTSSRREGTAGGSRPSGKVTGQPQRQCERVLPLFAPGPTHPAWPTILECYPELAPAVKPTVRKLVDGASRGVEFRVNQLRACGNSVVPCQAAVAFTYMWHFLELQKGLYK